MVDFVELLSKDDVAGCQQKIQALVKTLPKDIISWEEELVSLAAAIERYCHQEALAAILEELPEELLEPFYVRLLNAEKLASDIISGLTRFIVTKKNLRDGSTLNLVRILLFTSYPMEKNQLIDLTKRLDAQGIAKLLLELRQKAAQKNIDLDKKSLGRAGSNEQTSYQRKYQIFLTALTLDTNCSLFKLPTVVQNNPFLANLIIIKRISCSSRDNFKKIIDDLLLHGRCYDWQDPRFKDVVLPVFHEVLASVDQKKSNQLLEGYIQLTHSGHPSMEDKVRLVDQYYFASYSQERLVSCIQMLTTQDPAFIINYLSLTSIKSSEVREKLLALLSIGTFPALTGHMFVLGKISLAKQEHSGIFEDFIKVFSQKLKALKQEEEIMHSFAEQYQYLPEAAQLQLMKEMNKHLAEQPLLQVQWLLTLKKIQADASVLWPFYDELLRAFPNRDEISQPLLKTLSSEELLKLYVYLVKEKAPPASYLCFRELFSDIERHPQLFFLISNTPAIPKDLLSGFVDNLDDRTIITLLDNLIEKKSENSEYANTLNQVMLKFCQRLFLSADKNNAIHQWTDQPFTADLVVHLLENPDCVYALCLSKSLPWHWITWSSIPQALKLRIDRLLNATRLDDAVIQRMVSNCLSHFRLHPEKLRLIFSHLNQSAENRNAIGNDNYLRIRKSCWDYLDCQGEYTDAAFQRLCLHFKNQTVIDTILHKQAAEQLLLDNPSQGARLLALTQVPLPDNFSNALLLSLLVHSVHEDSVNNWQKISERLKFKTLADNISFFKALMDKVLQVAFNPVLVEKAYELITESLYFDELILECSEQEVLWLIQYSSADSLKKAFIHWFDLLLKKHGVEGFNLGRLLTHLPKDEPLMDVLFSHKALESPDSFAILFVQLASSPDSESFLVGLHKKIISQDAYWMKAFLIKVQALQTEKTSMMAAHILNVCILTVSEGLKTHDPKHRSIYGRQFELLNMLFKRPDNEGLQKEILQLILNLLTEFSRLDCHWTAINFQSEPTVQAIINSLQLIDLSKGANSVYQHPLAHLFLDNLTVPLNHRLKSHQRFQLFISRLFEYPNALINTDHYLILFDLLDADHQQALVKNIAEIKHRHSVHTALMPFMARSISITALYQIFTQQPDDFLIVEAIFCHPEGLKDLSQSQAFELIDAIQSSEQLFKVLNGYTHPQTRTAFVRAVYESADNDWQRLSEKFSKWGLNKQTLAAIANYTKEAAHQHVLGELLANKSFYGHYLEEYIRCPSMDMGLESGGYLKKMLHQRLLIHHSGREFDASFLAYFEPKGVFENLKNQFDNTLQGFTVIKTLEPMQNCDTVLNDALTAARWFHQLPLSEALAFILARYLNSDKEIQHSIAQTKLFDTVIKPLLDPGETGGGFMSLSSGLPGLLSDFARDVNEVQPKQSQWIKQILASYQDKLTTMAALVSPRVYDFFKPDSIFASKKAGKTMSFLSQDCDLLTARADTGGLEERQLALKKAMAIVFKKADLMSDETFHSWLFEKVFFSPVSVFFDKQLLRQYFQSAPPMIWTRKLQRFHHTCQQLRAGLDDLAPLAQHNSFDAVLDYLGAFDTKKIKLLSSVARTMNMMHIADFMLLVLYARLTHLSVKRIIYQLSPQADNNDLGVEWLNNDAREIEYYKQFLSSRFEDLVTQGFACDAKPVDISYKLSALKVAYSTYVSPDLLVNCLNSYRVIFSNKKGTGLEFLNAFKDILRTGDHAVYIINAMQGDIVRSILDLAMNDILHNQGLLHLMLNSNYKHFCQQHLEQQVFTLLGLEEALKVDPLYSVLIKKRAADLSSEKCLQLTALLRLLAIANPQGEFAILKEMDFLPGQHYKKQAFIADISTCQLLESLNENHSDSKAWLKKQCHEGFFPYQGTLDAVLGQKPAECPLAYYHWMLWRSQLDPQPAHFIDGFLYWLNALDESRLTVNTKLSNLLQIIADKGLLSLVCQRVVEADCLNPNQLDWLSKAIVSLARFKADYLCDVIKISAPEHLEKIMPLITKQALSSFSPEDIMALLKNSGDNTLKAMMSTHLLCRDDFIKRLSGTSFIKQLSVKGSISPPRLQPLLSQLDVRLLTPETIAGLSEEAAVSCLFSAQHFHEWSKEQVCALLGRYPADAVFQHWVCHYSMMPNAMFMIAHLFSQADSKIFYVMDKIMSPAQKKALLSRIIENLELFEFSKAGFVERGEESHLIEAIQRYNEGQHTDIRQAFIKALLKRLLSEGHHFSDKAINSLFSLQNKKEFIDFNYQFEAVYNQYLRCSAASGNIDIFYKEGALGFAETKIILALQPQKPKNKVQAVFQKALQKLLRHKDSVSHTLPDENPIIKSLIKFNKPVKAIDYFLMHYQGKEAVLNKLLDDYFSRFTWASPDELKALYSTSILMRRKEVSDRVRRAIFSAFRSHPALLDQTISRNVFLFDAETMIKEYGMAKKYQQLIDNCTLILDNESLNPPVDQETKALMRKAREDALFEMRMSEMSGSFLALRRWFHRCRYYGWKGLFVPKNSEYVAAFDSESSANDVQTVQVAHVNPSLTAAEALKTALESGYYKHIHEALGRYNNSIPDDSELSLRQAVDEIYQSLLKEAPQDAHLNAWLETSESRFLDNRQRIIECLLKKGHLDDVRQHLDLYADGPGDFARIRTRFTVDNTLSLLPAVADKPEPDLKTQVQADLKAVADTAADNVFMFAEYIRKTWLFWNAPPTPMIEQGTSEPSPETQKNPVF